MNRHTTPVHLLGWRDPKNERRVQLVQSLRRWHEVSLRDAKKLMESFVDRGMLVIPFADESMARAFIEEARTIGVLVASV